ncbi:two-component system sensor histidine kinase DesK [Nonomuraea fuscirosea]|uniref:Two-component system sensor histidine kinase DesK n=2 Tax=Nonomuraea fuscirosea TaxID=1291556 RepID=A0A2T0MSP9_9ACTN|nr:two-component system sensor histidine kinase DesK [Nonomuraea fuscirosea]
MALSPPRLLAAYISLICLLRVTFHLGETSTGPLMLACIVAVAALQLPISLSGGRRAVLVIPQIVLNWLPLVAGAGAGEWRGGGSGFVVASMLLAVSGPWAWSLVALIVVVEGGAAIMLDLPPVLIYYAIIAPINGGLILYGLSRLVDLVDRAGRERAELAARAGEVERLRLWGHVHSLVVSSVSAVERLARRERDPEAIRRAVAIAREALQRVRSLPAAEAAVPVPSGGDDPRVLRLATPILVVTHALSIGQSIFNFAADAGLGLGSGHAAYMALLPVTLALQFWHLAALRAGTRPRWLAWTLAAQAVAIYAPLLQGDAYGLAVSGFFAGVVLLCVRGLVAWPLCVVICAVAALESWPRGPAVAVYQVCGALATALAVHGLTRLAALVIELGRTRAELVEVTALRERIKVGRDVHDLLGRGLTAIVLHAELALRLLRADPVRASEQLERVADAARAALTDAARVNVPGHRLSLAAELDSARAVLESTGAIVRIEATSVAGPAGSVLAVVLREAVTNVLRHSTPYECVIEIAVEDGHVRLRVTNDGASHELGEPGAGLRNLRARLAAVGGELTTTRTGDRFELLARTPDDHEDLTPTR